MTKPVEVKLVAKAEGFDAAFAKLTTGAEQARARVNRAFGDMRTAAAGLVSGLAAGAFVAWVKSAVDAADKLNDLAKTTQVAAVTLGGIGYAASKAGADVDGVAKAFGKLNLKIADARAGNAEAIRDFGKLGVTLDDLKNKSSADILVDLADTFASYEDDANKAAAGNAIFSKSYAEILPLLDEGGEALRQNIAYFREYSGVTEEVIAASDAFNDQIARIQLLNRGFAMSLAAELLPALTKLGDLYAEGKEKGDGFRGAAEAAAGPLRTLADWAANVAIRFAGMGEILGARIAQLRAIATLNFSEAGAIGDDINARAAAIERTIARVTAAINTPAVRAATNVLDDLQNGSAGGGGRTRRKAPNFGNAGPGAKAAKKETDEYAKTLERLAKMAAGAQTELAEAFGTEPITKAQRALAELIASPEWRAFTEPQRQEITRQFGAIAETERQTAAWKAEREEREKAIKALEEQQAAMADADRAFTANLGAYAEGNAALEKEIGLVGRSRIAHAELAETLELERLKRQALLVDDDPAAAAARIAMLEKEFARRIQLLRELDQAEQDFAASQQINTVFADAFADALASVADGSKSLADAFKDMERDIVRAISNIAAQNLAKALFGVGDSAGGPADLFGWIGKLLGGLAGGSGGGGGDILSNLQGFANGGAPPVGRLSLVGERGPELILPRTPVNVVPISAARGADLTLHQTINVLPGADARSARQAAAQLRDATVRAIKDR